MEPQKTPEQVAQLNTWAAQRDALLLEVSVNRTENDKLIIANKQLAESSSELTTRINQSTGRIEELTKKETELISLTSGELAILLVKKTQLESEVNSLQKQVSLLLPQKLLIEETIKSLTDVHDRVFDRVGVLDKVVDHVVKVNAKNIDDMNYFVKDLVSKKNSITDMIITLTNTYDRVAARTEMLDKVIDRIVVANSKILSDINNILNK